MRILLLTPPIFDFYFTPARREPLGLLYIKLAVQKKFPHIIIDIYDSRQKNSHKTQKWPDYLSYLLPFYEEDYSTFSLLQNFFRFGDSFDKICAFIEKENYDLIAISSLFSAYHADVENLVQKIKKITTSPVAIGGWALFGDLSYWLEYGNADYYLYGDGEEVLPALITKLQNFNNSSKKYENSALNPAIKEEVSHYLDSANGIYYKQSPTQLTKQPHWIQSDFFLNNYVKRSNPVFYRKEKFASTILSKGCVYRCAFCAIPRQQIFRKRTVEHLAWELKYIFKIGVRTVNFEDDNLLEEPVYASRLLTLLSRFHLRGMKFTAMNGITACHLLRHLPEAIHAGFIEFNVSMVSSKKNALSLNQRMHNQKCIEQIAWNAYQSVPVLVFLIAGLMGTDPEDLLQDILFLAKLPVIIGFSPLYLLPGVPALAKIGLPENRSLMRGSALYRFANHNTTREDIASLWKLVRWINAIKRNGNDYIDESDYWKRSIQEKTWYRLDKQGKWHPTFSFSINIPLQLKICDLQGNFHKIDYQL